MATSHYYSFTHDRGIVEFTDHDAEKTYRFNINSGEFVNLNTGKPVKGCPVGFGKFIESYCGDDLIVRLMYAVRQNARSYGLPVGNNGYILRDFTALTQIANLFVLLDRAQSLGATIGNRYWRVLDPTSLEELAKYFKDFAKYCRENENPTLCDFFENGGATYFAARNNLGKYHLSDDALNYLYEHRYELSDDKIQYAAYYMARGLYEFTGCSTMGYLRQFFSLCDKLGVEPPKEDFYRSFINFKREYEMRKKEIDAAALTRNYNRKRDALTFEMGDYCVVIPQTSDDFKREADSQHNCVFSTYLSQVVEGKTHVVFIRRKDALDKSVITCEVWNGHITQFLERYNCRPTDSELLAFKDAYQRHLADNWNK